MLDYRMHFSFWKPSIRPETVSDHVSIAKTCLLNPFETQWSMRPKTGLARLFFGVSSHGGMRFFPSWYDLYRHKKTTRAVSELVIWAHSFEQFLNHPHIAGRQIEFRKDEIKACSKVSDHQSPEKKTIAVEEKVEVVTLPFSANSPAFVYEKLLEGLIKSQQLTQGNNLTEILAQICGGITSEPVNFANIKQIMPRLLAARSLYQELLMTRITFKPQNEEKLSSPREALGEIIDLLQRRNGTLKDFQGINETVNEYLANPSSTLELCKRTLREIEVWLKKNNNGEQGLGESQEISAIINRTKPPEYPVINMVDFAKIVQIEPTPKHMQEIAFLMSCFLQHLESREGKIRLAYLCANGNDPTVPGPGIRRHPDYRRLAVMDVS